MAGDMQGHHDLIEWLEKATRDHLSQEALWRQAIDDARAAGVSQQTIKLTLTKAGMPEDRVLRILGWDLG
jgi:hypothetical protein